MISLVEDRLYIEGNLYTVQNIHSLPFFDVSSLHQVTNESTISFLGMLSIFSNFHPTPIVIDGITYTSNEQYIQSSKARHVNDLNTETLIMMTDDPSEMKRIGVST